MASRSGSDGPSSTKRTVSDGSNGGGKRTLASAKDCQRVDLSIEPGQRKFELEMDSARSRPESAQRPGHQPSTPAPPGRPLASKNRDKGLPTAPPKQRLRVDEIADGGAAGVWFATRLRIGSGYGGGTRRDTPLTSAARDPEAKISDRESVAVFCSLIHKFGPEPIRIFSPWDCHRIMRH